MKIVGYIFSLLEKIVEKYIHETNKKNQSLLIISKNQIPNKQITTQEHIFLTQNCEEIARIITNYRFSNYSSTQ